MTTIAGTCEYDSTGALGGTYNTGGTVASLTRTSTPGAENGFKLISGGALCPSSYTFDLSFELETAAGGKLTIS